MVDWTRIVALDSTKLTELSAWNPDQVTVESSR